MNPMGDATQRRFLVSALIALPMTVALLFLMTRLILPSGKDPIVVRMIRDIEFLRANDVPLQAQIQVFELPLPVEIRPPLLEAVLPVEDFGEAPDQVSDESPTEESPAHVIDWWAEARRLTQEAGEEEFKRWMLEQGYERYVSIMQGPLPITNSVQETLPPSQEDATGYLNSYGDLEIKISENCVMQTLISTRFDMSDFGRKLPMRVTCKGKAKKKYSFDPK
jgi:hypothetical protein